MARVTPMPQAMATCISPWWAENRVVTATEPHPKRTNTNVPRASPMNSRLPCTIVGVYDKVRLILVRLVTRTPNGARDYVTPLGLTKFIIFLYGGFRNSGAAHKMGFVR